MALDQSQEHSIKFLKKDGETWGLYGHQEEKDVIELSKPEIIRVIEEFETATLNGLKADINFEHQESSIAEQRKFLLDLRTLLNLV